MRADIFMQRLGLFALASRPAGPIFEGESWSVNPVFGGTAHEENGRFFA
jgi:hypothetical protein